MQACNYDEEATDAGACDGAWAALRTSEAVLEGFVPFSKEVSVVAARDVRGNCQTYPLCENEHANHILDVTTVPADVPAAVSDAANARNFIDIRIFLPVKRRLSPPKHKGYGALGLR